MVEIATDSKVLSLRDLDRMGDTYNRRLRYASPTVNKVLSPAGHFVVSPQYSAKSEAMKIK